MTVTAGEIPAWILVEREHGVPVLVGHYPGEHAAELALDSLLIDGLAEEDAVDVYVVTKRPTFEVEEIIPDLNNPHHTGIDGAEEAPTRDSSGGGQRNAQASTPNRPGAYDLDVTTTQGDAGLPLLKASIGPADVWLYQHRDENNQPLPVVVVEVDHDDDVEIRAHY